MKGHRLTAAAMSVTAATIRETCGHLSDAQRREQFDRLFPRVLVILKHADRDQRRDDDRLGRAS